MPASSDNACKRQYPLATIQTNYHIIRYPWPCLALCGPQLADFVVRCCLVGLQLLLQPHRQSPNREKLRLFHTNTKMFHMVGKPHNSVRYTCILAEEICGFDFGYPTFSGNGMPAVIQHHRVRSEKLSAMRMSKTVRAVATENFNVGIITSSIRCGCLFFIVFSAFLTGSMSFMSMTVNNGHVWRINPLFMLRNFLRPLASSRCIMTKNIWSRTFTNGYISTKWIHKRHSYPMRGGHALLKLNAHHWPSPTLPPCVSLSNLRSKIMMPWLLHTFLIRIWLPTIFLFCTYMSGWS